LVEFLAHQKIHPENYSSNSAGAVTNGQGDGYLCTLCGEYFSKETLLRIHQVQKHSFSLVARLSESPLIKSVCPRLTWSSEEVEKKPNFASKRFKCRHCEKRFVLPSQCKSHENAHSEVPATVKEEATSNSEGSSNFFVNSSESSVLVLSDSENIQLDSIPNGFPSPFSSETESYTPAFEENTELTQETSTFHEEMTTQNTNCETSNFGTMEMPKLIAPIKMESIQLHELSDLDLANLQGGHENAISCYVTTVSTYSTSTLVKSEPTEMGFNSSMANVEVKQEPPVIEQRSYAMTNGDIFTREG